jgi:hypothetical protein
MHDWECALLQIEIAPLDKLKINPTQFVNDKIGQRLIKKYMIKMD